MDKVLKNIINKTIEREYNHAISDTELLYKRNVELAKEYKECQRQAEHIKGTLLEVIPEEYHKLIDELEENLINQMACESRIMFKEGLALGATELSYLGEVGIVLAFTGGIGYV